MFSLIPIWTSILLEHVGDALYFIVPISNRIFINRSQDNVTYLNDLIQHLQFQARRRVLINTSIVDPEIDFLHVWKQRLLPFLTCLDGQLQFIIVGSVWMWSSIVPWCSFISTFPAMTDEDKHWIVLVNVVILPVEMFIFWTSWSGPQVFQIFQVEEHDGRKFILDKKLFTTTTEITHISTLKSKV